MSEDKINFPIEFDPANAPVFMHNEIQINADSEKIWYWLTNATTWNEWYVNASDMEIIDQQDKRLLAGTKFNWKTFGAKLNSEIKEFIPHQRLAWKAKGFGILAYHAWLIIPDQHGCKVITEETQHGFLCRLQNIFMPNRTPKYHQIWLEGLKKKSEGN